MRLAVSLLVLGGCSPEPVGLDGGDPVDTGPTVDEEALRALLGLPDHLEIPYAPAENPLTAEGIALGRHLFYDRRLSGNETQRCADCHDQALAFADGKKTPTGSTGDVLFRNSPGLANVAYFSALTWAHSELPLFEDQLLVPITNDTPIELGVSDGLMAEVMGRFDADPAYVTLFTAAFPQTEPGATLDKVVFALSSFCRSLISGDSPYDRYVAGDHDALTEQQKLGLTLFNGERFECFHCHGGINLTASYRDANTPDDAVQNPFFNTGLYNVGGDGSFPAYDQGLFNVTLDSDHRGLFRPQNLRNVALTAPYMHDGSIPTLRDVVLHYAAGGRLIEEGPYAGDGRVSPLKSGLVRGFTATDDEIDAVVAFLESTTDPEFLANPAYSDPFED